MIRTLHITNGDSAAPGIRTADEGGDILPWRDVLHEGPVPAGLDLKQLSRIRAAFLADEGMGVLTDLERSFAERDDTLRRFADYDEVVLWFEWDLYDQLQLIQLLDFFSSHSADDLAETGTRISLVCIEGYLGTSPIDAFLAFYESRRDVTMEMLELGRRAWAAFRSDDPRNLQEIAGGDCSALEFLAEALVRQLEELPSARNGLSRSENQILESIAQRPITFSEIFKRTSNRESRIYCGDATMARYIERMSRHTFPLLLHPTGESVEAPRTAEDSRAFRNAEIALTGAGSEVLWGDRDWIDMGGTDRWLGGVRLEGPRTLWRWDSDTRSVVARAESSVD